jgi:hypothetical protein
MSLNSLIANTHRVQRKMNGVTVSLGSMISIVLSSVLIMLGVVSVLYTNDPALFTGPLMYIMTPVAIGIACVSAFLMDRLTLVSCAKVRLGHELLQAKEEAFEQLTLVSEPTERIRQHHEQEIAKIKRGYRPSYLGIAFGTILSVMMESFFVHYIFLGWANPIWFLTSGEIASVLLSGLVSFTLISSEISKKQDHAVIEESLTSDGFMQVAAEADVKDETNRHLLLNSGPKVGKILEGEVLDVALDESVTKMIAQNLGSKDITKKIAEHREAKQLQIAQQSEQTKAQLTLLIGGKAKQNVPQEDLEEEAQEVIEATVEPVEQKQVSRATVEPYQTRLECVKQLLDTHGYAYFTESVLVELGSRWNVQPKTVQKYMRTVSA